MSDEGRKKRLGAIASMPLGARLDHRFFLNPEGKDKRIESLPRHLRRKVQKEGQKIGEEYFRRLKRQEKSGAGYPVDELLRLFSIEYNSRYATSGTGTQPISFNYIEPFLRFSFLPNSVAPFLDIRDELDNILYLNDLLDFVTDPSRSMPSISNVYEGIADGNVIHYSVNGNINDNTYLTSEHSEFVVSGFSLAKHGRSLHWYLLGGLLLTEDAWAAASEHEPFKLENVPPEKRPFLAQSMGHKRGRRGPPLPLAGTERAVRTVLMGEFDLLSERHVGRCMLTEYENSFDVVCDDPDVLTTVGHAERTEMMGSLLRRLEEAAPLWNIADVMLYAPQYFDERLVVQRKAGGRAPPRMASAGQSGRGSQLKYVSSVEFVEDATQPFLRSYMPPRSLSKARGTGGV